MWFLFPTLTFCAFSTFFRVPLQLALVIFSSQHDPSAADLASPRFLRMDSLEAPTATSQQQPSPGASPSVLAAPLPGPSTASTSPRTPGPSGADSNACR